jgi:hypothetical protein
VGFAFFRIPTSEFFFPAFRIPHSDFLYMLYALCPLLDAIFANNLKT